MLTSGLSRGVIMVLEGGGLRINPRPCHSISTVINGVYKGRKTFGAWEQNLDAFMTALFLAEVSINRRDSSRECRFCELYDGGRLR